MLHSLSTIDFILLSGLGIIFLIQCYFYLSVFGKFAFYKAKPFVKTNNEPVSIIIAARNEYDNLQRSLPTILNQDYPEFEVIVINHCSWDASQQLLEDMQLQYPHLKVSQLREQEKYPTGKKFALTIGIKAAKYNQLLFTDADCEPASNQWLALMQSRLGANKEIVLGYSPFIKKGGFLNLFARFVSFITAIFYYSFALMGNTFMGVGRNLMYTKDLFFKHKGFANHQHIMSGDDDLFVNEAATASNVAIEINTDSFVFTEAKTTFDQYVRQKTRHMTTGKYYKPKHKQALGIFYASLFLFYSLVIVTLIVNIFVWPIVLVIYLLRLVIQYIVFYPSAVKLTCAPVLWYLPLLDILYLFYLVFFGTQSLFIRNTKVW